MAILVVLGFRLVLNFFGKQKAIKIMRVSVAKPGKKRNIYKKFVVLCFGGDIILYCKKPENPHFNNACTESLRRSLMNICQRMKPLGAKPLDKLIIDINEFKTNKFNRCMKEIERASRCTPYFIRMEKIKIKGYGAGFIFVPDKYMKDTKNRDTVLAHEIAHGLVSRYGKGMTRIINEFFAVYTQSKLIKNPFHTICYGKVWNQPALATASGNYPMLSANKGFLSSTTACRYGQLEYLTRLLDKKFPELYKKLWKKLEAHKKGAIDIARLKQWIKEINKNAWKFVVRFYILKQTDSKPHIVVTNYYGGYYFFAYRFINQKEDKYYRRNIKITIQWLRGVKLIAEYSTGANDHSLYLRNKNLVSGDILRVKAVIKGKELHGKFIVP